MKRGIGTICFAIGIIWLGAWMLIQGINETFLARQSYKWPHVIGKITSSSIFERRLASGTTFTPHVQYRYYVDGKVYEGNRIWFGTNGSGKRDDAEYVTTMFQVGTGVPVFFRPNQPQVSCLEPGKLHGTIYGKFFLSIMLIITGLFFGLWWYINDSPKRYKQL